MLLKVGFIKVYLFVYQKNEQNLIYRYSLIINFENQKIKKD